MNNSTHSFTYNKFRDTNKVIPMICVSLSLLNTTLSYFYINVEILSYIGSVSLVTLVLLYLTSYVFKFCDTHRI